MFGPNRNRTARRQTTGCRRLAAALGPGIREEANTISITSWQVSRISIFTIRRFVGHNWRTCASGWTWVSMASGSTPSTFTFTIGGSATIHLCGKEIVQRLAWGLTIHTATRSMCTTIRNRRTSFFYASCARCFDEYPDRTSIGEVFADDSIGVMAEYTCGNDKLHMAYTFELLGELPNPGLVRSVIAGVEAGIGDGWPCWALSNHDVERCVTRWGQGTAEPDRFALIVLALLFSLRGSVTLYQGEELGAAASRRAIFEDAGPVRPVVLASIQRTRRMPNANGLGRHRSRRIQARRNPGCPLMSGIGRNRLVAKRRTRTAFYAQRANFLRWRKRQPALLTGEINAVERYGRAVVLVAPQRPTDGARGLEYHGRTL